MSKLMVQLGIEQKLLNALQPAYLLVENESHNHSVPANSETHFKVTLVCDAFANMRKVARHQKVYQILQEELAGPVHALAMHLYDADEWQKACVPESPDCLGGSKSD